MTDLTTSLVTLSRAAEGRRTARKALRDALSTCCAAIVAECRSGDTVAVGGHRYEIRRLTWCISQGGGFGVRLHPRGANVLCRDGAALHDVRESWHDSHNLLHVHGGYSDDAGDVAMATDAERVAAVADLGEVIGVLAVLHAEQATGYGDAAEQIARAVPR